MGFNQITDGVTEQEYWRQINTRHRVENRDMKRKGNVWLRGLKLSRKYRMDLIVIKEIHIKETTTTNLKRYVPFTSSGLNKEI